MNKLRKIGLAVFMLLVLLFSAAFVMKAQDVPLATNTAAVVTEAAPVVVAPVTPVVSVPAEKDTSTVYVVGFLVLLAFSGLVQVIQQRNIGALMGTVNRALDNKQVIDAAHQRYMEASLPTQEFIKLLAGVASFVGASNLPMVDATADKVAGALQTITSEDDADRVNVADLQRMVRASGGTGTKPLDDNSAP